MTTINAVNNGLSGSTGSGAFVGANTPTLITPIIGAATGTSLVFSPTTSGIVGTTTNDNASSGYVGEFISSNIQFASAVSFSSTVIRDVTSISLTAGDWDVWGNIYFTYSVGTTICAAWVSATSASVPDASLLNAITPTTPNFTSFGFSVPLLRFSLSGTTTIYLSAGPGTFSGTCTGCGGIYARRIR